MSARPIPPPKNPDRVAKPVAGAAAVGVLVSALARILLDGYVDPADHDVWWNVVQTVVVPGVPFLLAWLAARRARGNVTPILTAQGDIPRNLEGRELKASGHGPEAGYVPREHVQAPRKPRRGRVDRRGVDRDPTDVGP